MSEELKPIQQENISQRKPTEPFPAGQNWKDEKGGEFSDEEIATSKFGGSDTRCLNHGTIFLLLSCVLAVVGIYFFSTRYQPKEASAEAKAVEAQVDQALQKFVNRQEQAKTKQLFTNSEKMVQAFYEYPVKQQVPVDELQKNPFSRYEGVEEEAPVNSSKEKERLLKELDQQLGELDLQSVVQTDRGARCLIDGRIYQKGQVIDGAFTIESIEKEQVKLSAQGFEFSLDM